MTAQAIAATIAGLLAEMATLQADSVTTEPVADGTLVHIRVAGSDHTILCELDAAGQLRAARVIEL